MSTNEALAGDSLPASDAFGALANEARIEVVEAMGRREAEGRTPARFSELFAESDAETTAGFSYHLDALVGLYLRKVETGDGSGESADGRHGAGYELTHAGREVARALAAGTYAPRSDRSVPVGEPCPRCGEAGLSGESSDGVLAIGCEACSQPILSLAVPAGLADGGEVPEAFDRHHRHRLAAFADGRCPECGGHVEREVVPAGEVRDGSAARAGVEDHADADRVQAAFSCDQCGHGLRAPVTLAVMDHPAVVAFYHDHGRDVGDRPIWNVGSEWTESILSEEPLCVRVVADLAGDSLALYVDRDLAVREVQRTDRS
ncbi:DUF7351 domain-containing protein [Saliphagus infecundisoli]|uniref:ArsR family transcriptional regulator n=1 Tax=Saliphagus infecundisoli TaxID=1849069 RepID=A0ABD5QD05_9EURY|nr:ArsR family transcriptional regulator [Saliphagus infecundisoli]